MPTENELYEAWRNASDDATRGELREQLFQKVTGHAEAVVWKSLPEWDPDRDDLVQDIVMAVFENITSFNGKSKFSTWVGGVANNKVKEEWRNRKNHEKVIDESLGLEDSEHGLRVHPSLLYPPDFDTKIFLDELRDGLPEKERQLLQCKSEEMTSAESGEILGVSADAVDSRWARFKPKLEKKYHGSDGKGTSEATN